MRRLLQNGQCIMAAAPRFQVSLALTDFLLPDFTLAGRAGGVVVHMRKRDGREAGQESTGSSAGVTEKSLTFTVRKVTTGA